MRTQNPSDELITQPNFGRRPDAEPPSNDPIIPTSMVVDIDQIDFYDRNPRRAENPEFENIKNGIRASKGLDWALNITRRPGAERYMLAAGGNSTLRAVKELFRETGDPCFEQIHCLYIPWTGDDDVLLAHLKENDQRGDLILIDRARAVRDLRELIEAERGKSLSQREFAEQLQARGYNISRRVIGWLDYAVDVLSQIIPFALKSGMGKAQVERLRNLERAFNTAWAVLNLEEAEIEGLFTGVLERHDSEYVDPDLVRADLEAELMVSADCDILHAGHLLGLALDNGLSAEEVRTRLAKTPERVPFPGEEENPKESDGAPPSISRDNTAGGGVGSDIDPPTQEQPEPLSRSSDTNPLKDPPFGEFPGDEANLTLPATQGDTLSDINTLRGQAFGLARDLAKYMGANDIVVPIDSGYGFLVGPMPHGGHGLINDYTVEHGDRTRLLTDALWWMLATLSEQFSVSRGAIPHIPPEWSDRPIGEAMRQGKRFPVWQAENLNRDAVNDVPFIPIPHLGTYGFNFLEDQPWNTWHDLVSTTRQICKLTLTEPWGQESRYEQEEI